MSGYITNEGWNKQDKNTPYGKEWKLYYINIFNTYSQTKKAILFRNNWLLNNLYELQPYLQSWREMCMAIIY